MLDSAQRRTPLRGGAPRRTGTAPRNSGPFAGHGSSRRTVVVISALVLLSGLIVFGLLAHGNPMPPGSEGFWLIAERRQQSVLVIAVVAVAQATATVAFQTVANNRIITPSIMGFDALYTAVHTTSVYLFGIAGIALLAGPVQFLLQIGLMVGLAVLLYGWLLSGKRGNLQIMLLVGIVIGGGLGAVSTFMQRMLTPSEFDVLAARLFGSISNASADSLPYAIPLVVISTAVLWSGSRRLNVMAMGRDVANSLGLQHRRELMRTLFFVAVLIATSTALVGPMVFLGFLVAALAYQLADTFDHRVVLPIAALTAFVVLGGAYFVMKHVFSAQGVVSIIIEVVGGTLFLIVILRKGRL
ncbi:enterochelin ABC transporter permease [Leucobacter sp. Ag1]|uniref:iron chelate uptake ABC transporter family permease subunit n=1 Tax=Leucobacter sp. Ag1 TaxID=1642040 RepID=UPI0006227DA2|nr:iron chelate uptake ABC transporter family permease subunit [Leucobacter sp. Ag1]KKI21434.1 enterochelin ABC transporter permease [Leucobacter sp. Ag1]